MESLLNIERILFETSGMWRCIIDVSMFFLLEHLVWACRWKYICLETVLLVFWDVFVQRLKYSDMVIWLIMYINSINIHHFLSMILDSLDPMTSTPYFFPKISWKIPAPLPESGMIHQELEKTRGEVVKLRWSPWSFGVSFGGCYPHIHALWLDGTWDVGKFLLIICVENVGIHIMFIRYVYMITYSLPTWREWE